MEKHAKIKRDDLIVGLINSSNFDRLIYCGILGEN